jgi:hypothetical protein
MMKMFDGSMTMITYDEGKNCYRITLSCSHADNFMIMSAIWVAGIVLYYGKLQAMSNDRLIKREQKYGN